MTWLIDLNVILFVCQNPPLPKWRYGISRLILALLHGLHIGSPLMLLLLMMAYCFRTGFSVQEKEGYNDDNDSRGAYVYWKHDLLLHIDNYIW